MRVFSTFIAWSNENKSCMTVDKREFTWEFSQLSLLDHSSLIPVIHYWRGYPTEYYMIWFDLIWFDLTSECLHESFLNIHCLIKREQELHESWQARVYMRVFSLNFHCLIKREQELHGSWEARVYMRVFSTFIAWLNENKSCMRVKKREFTWEFSQRSLLDQTRTRVAWELTSECLHETFLNFHCLIKREQELHESREARVYMRVFSTFIAWSNENKSCMTVDKREFTWEFSQLSVSLLDQTRTIVA